MLHVPPLLFQPANFYELQFSVMAIGYKFADKGSDLNPSLKLEIVPYPEDKEDTEEEVGEEETERALVEDEGEKDNRETRVLFDIDGDYNTLFETEKWIAIK